MAESSPANDSSPTSPLQLTPNSKVKALLASLDNDSDEETVSGSAIATLNSTFAQKPTAKTPSPLLDSGIASERTLAQDPKKDPLADDEDEDEDIFRPKGRLAARMQATEDSSESEVEIRLDDARERVKKMLMNPESTISGQDAEDNDKSDTSVVPLKRKVRVRRRSTPTSSPQEGSASPNLFVSPTKSAGTASNASDSEELPSNPLENARFKALVEKKRQERLEKEAQAAEQKAKSMTELKRQRTLVEQNDMNDDFVEQRLTQQTKPTRKASKKAQEEIAREVQRMSRNMQLAHEARTRKKITKADLFKRFNYKPVGMKEQNTDGPTSSSPAPHSDIEKHETPPTSPASHGGDVEKPSVVSKSLAALNDLPKLEDRLQAEVEEDLPPLEIALTSSPPQKLDKGKGKATGILSPDPKLENIPVFKQRPVRIRPPVTADRKESTLADSDSDLEILTAKTPDARMKKLDAIFDRVPVNQAKESRPLQALKILAHLTSPGKQTLGRNQKPSMTTTQLHLSLQQRARQQAAREKEERIEALRAKGIIPLTAEEREKVQAEGEDLMEMARREGEDLRRKEKAAAKKERKEKGEEDPFRDSSDDEDWKDGKDDLELSGSDSDDQEEGASDASGEEEDNEDDDEEEDELALDGQEQERTAIPNVMFDNEADETDDDEAEAQLSTEEQIRDPGDLDDHQEDEDVPINWKSRRVRKSNIISDDEDEGNPVVETPSAPRTVSPTQLHTDSPKAPNSVLRSATKTFIPGLTIAGPAGLGLTQIFAGTMDDSQIEDFDESSAAPNSISQMDAEQDSLAFLRRLPALNLPPFVPTTDEDSAHDVVLDSQPGTFQTPESQSAETQTQGLQLGLSQSQVHGFDSLVDHTATQFSEFPEATQDVGFQHMTPIRGRFVEPPPSTVDTLVAGRSPAIQPMGETPVVKKKGKLRRRAQVATFSDEEEVGEHANAEEEEEAFEISANVFDVMRKASKRKEVSVEEFDKKTSKAKEMVHEQADESEDEYAGLGGASDDESGGEEDGYVKEMIDDEGGKDMDERKLAAFFADRERKSDEKQVEKLYSDITKGMLRRKRGADYDLSDSDDGGEARKRMKRREFAKMRKALLADERIGKIAENPKKQAFLRALEDRVSDNEMDFLDEFAEKDEGTDSQMSQAEVSQQRVPDSQPDTIMGPPKRSDDVSTKSRAAPQLRRTNPSKRPSNLTEIRESLSSLIEEPNAMVTAESGSDSEKELEIDLSSRVEKEKENRDPFALRRKHVPIIDRISLKRASSSSLSSSTRFAFAASSSAPGFQVPPLLRRATTNSSLASTSSTTSSANGGTSSTERMAGGAGSDGIKRGGGKNSGVHYFARESERRAAVMKTEKRREQKMFKGAEVRRKAVGGLFGGGKFE